VVNVAVPPTVKLTVSAPVVTTTSVKVYSI
jgi:hypothetical protein